MSRLIDADALIEVIKKYKFGAISNESEREYTREVMLCFLNGSPTAYDVEKVVAELEEEVEYQDKKADEADAFEEVSVSSARISMRKCYEHAIEIVRKGSEST